MARITVLETPLAVATNLAGMGYYVVPVHPRSRAAAGKAWTQRLDPDASLRRFSRDNGVGLLLGPTMVPDVSLVAVDIDVNDDLLIDRIQTAALACDEHEAPAKFGSKGLTLIYRYVPTKDDRKKWQRGGQDCVDFLCDGTQTVLPPSIHHSTGRPYVWRSRPLHETKPEDIPKIDKWVVQEMQWAVSKIDALVFKLNDMMPRAALTNGGIRAGNVDDTCTAVMMSLLDAGWPEEIAVRRCMWATRRADQLHSRSESRDYAEWERRLHGMYKSAERKPPALVKKQKLVVQVASWLVNEWRGPGAVLSRDGQLYAYEDGFYSLITPDLAKHLVWKNRIRNSEFSMVEAEIAAVYKTAMVMADRMPPRPVNSHRVCLANCTFDMDDGSVSPWSEDDHLISRVDVEHVPDATCPIYDAFIRRLVNDDDKSVAALEEFIAYTLIESHAFERMLILLGPTACGKSTLTRLLIRMHGGPARVSSVGIGDMGNGQVRAMMSGKLLNVMPEASSMTQAADEQMKAIISGEMTNWKVLYQDQISGVLPTRFIITTNEMFRTRDGSGALERRMLIIKCSNTVPAKERDVQLGDKLWEERSGIFIRLAAAWRRLLGRGDFDKPAAHIEAIEEFTEENNAVLQWLQERTWQGMAHAYPEVVPPTLTATASNLLHQDCCDWLRQKRYKEMSDVTWGKKLKQITWAKAAPYNKKLPDKRVIKVRDLTLIDNGTSGAF